MRDITTGILASKQLDLSEYLPHTIIGKEGDERLHGRSADDRIFGNDGDDFLAGWAGNDKLDGGSGNDYLLGMEGNDALSGGNGKDTLVGGLGDDFMVGGNGADYFDVQSGGHDVIQDFNAHERDQLDLSNTALADASRFAVFNHTHQVTLPDGGTALRIDLGDGSDVTLVGLTEAHRSEVLNQIIT